MLGARKTQILHLRVNFDLSAASEFSSYLVVQYSKSSVYWAKLFCFATYLWLYALPNHIFPYGTKLDHRILMKHFHGGACERGYEKRATCQNLTVTGK